MRLKFLSACIAGAAHYAYADWKTTVSVANAPASSYQKPPMLTRITDSLFLRTVGSPIFGAMVRAIIVSASRDVSRADGAGTMVPAR